MDRSRVAIVIPALNEASTIAGLVQAVAVFGEPLVVDDGSNDGTAAIACEHGALVVRHHVNAGYDAALNSGFLKAHELGYSVVVTLDADGQHKPRLIEQFLADIDEGADIVVGVRSRKARIAEHLFAFCTQRRFGISDPLCGFKAYRIRTYEALGHFDSYRSIGTELLLFAAKGDFQISQVTFDVQDRVGVSRFGTSFRGNWLILHAMFKGFLLRRSQSGKSGIAS